MMPIKRRPPSPMMAAIEELAAASPNDLVTGTSTFSHSREIEVDHVEPDPEQPRKHFSEQEIAALAKTMADQGQLQPILVRRLPGHRDRWIIVAGERRWRAAKANKWPRVLAMEHHGDHDVATLVENLQRIDLTPVEEARGLRRLIDEKGWKQAEAAAVVGMHPTNVSSLLRILTLPSDFLDELVTSQVPRGVLIALARVEPGSTRDRFIELARAGHLTIATIRGTRQDTDAPGQVGVPSGGDEGEHKRGRIPRGLSFKGLDRLAEQLDRLKGQHNFFGQQERQCLVRLQRIITDLLEEDRG